MPSGATNGSGQAAQAERGCGVNPKTLPSIILTDAESSSSTNDRKPFIARLRASISPRMFGGSFCVTVIVGLSCFLGAEVDDAPNYGQHDRNSN